MEFFSESELFLEDNEITVTKSNSKQHYRSDVEGITYSLQEDNDMSIPRLDLAGNAIANEGFQLSPLPIL
jgi:hypothetical protein